MLRNAGIQNSSDISVNSIFEFLLMLVFQGQNLDRHLNSNRGLDQPRKDTYYRFLNHSKYAWRKFLNALAYKVIIRFDSLTSASHVFILDDSVFSRSRSKQVELLARVFDYANSKFVKGFTMLTLGWSNSFSFIPVDFSMLSSAKESNRLKDLDTSIDKRTSGYKRREEALLKKQMQLQKCLIILDSSSKTMAIDQKSLKSDKSSFIISLFNVKLHYFLSVLKGKKNRTK